MIKTTPTMGARSRGRLNKNGRTRQPSNMAGLHAPALGGLARATRANGSNNPFLKPVGFAEGGMVGPQRNKKVRYVGGVGGVQESGYFDPNTATRQELMEALYGNRSGIGPSYGGLEAAFNKDQDKYKKDFLAAHNALQAMGPLGMDSASGASAEPAALMATAAPPAGGLAAANTGATPSMPALLGAMPAGVRGGLSAAAPKGGSAVSTAPTELFKPQTGEDWAALLKSAYERTKQRNQQPMGNVNLPLLLASAKIMQPTRGGTFGEALGNAFTAGGEALQAQRTAEDARAQRADNADIEYAKTMMTAAAAERAQQLEAELKREEMANRIKVAQINEAQTGVGGEKSTAKIREARELASVYMANNPGISEKEALQQAWMVVTGLEGKKVGALTKAAAADAANQLAGMKEPLTKSQLEAVMKIYADSGIASSSGMGNNVATPTEGLGAGKFTLDEVMN